MTDSMIQTSLGRDRGPNLAPHPARRRSLLKVLTRPLSLAGGADRRVGSLLDAMDLAVVALGAPALPSSRRATDHGSNDPEPTSSTAISYRMQEERRLSMRWMQEDGRLSMRWSQEDTR
jgi:hypothetical protein